MAVTLAHVSKLEKDPLTKYILENLLRYSVLFEKLPFTTVNSLRSSALQWTNLPTVAFRKINADYSTSEGDITQVHESVYGFGGKIRVDRVWDKIKGTLIQDPERLQMDMMIKSMKYKFIIFLNIPSISILNSA